MQDFQTLEEKIGVKITDKDLLEKAFVHKSYVNEHKEEGVECNERLEFLGDAVLELVVTEYLFKNHPEQQEGEMTNWRSALVKGKHLAEVASDLKLGEYLYLSKGEEAGGGREKNYILANTLEALIGCIYLSEGYEAAHKFIGKFIIVKLKEILEQELHVDPKSKFQEIAQEKEGMTPDYKFVKAEGPDHSKIFTIGVYIGDKFIAEGDGSSKQKAESAAAEKALEKMGW